MVRNLALSFAFVALPLLPEGELSTIAVSEKLAYRSAYQVVHVAMDNPARWVNRMGGFCP